MQTLLDFFVHNSQSIVVLPINISYMLSSMRTTSNVIRLYIDGRRLVNQLRNKHSYPEVEKRAIRRQPSSGRTQKPIKFVTIYPFYTSSGLS